MDDNVLNPVAASQRTGGWSLLANTAGVGTTLAMLLIGGSASYLVCTKWAIAMAAISTIFGSLVGTLSPCQPNHRYVFNRGWAPSAGNAVLIYGVLSLLWILLTIFGMKVVQKTSLVLTICRHPHAVGGVQHFPAIRALPGGSIKYPAERGAGCPERDPAGMESTSVYWSFTSTCWRTGFRRSGC